MTGLSLPFPSHIAIEATREFLGARFETWLYSERVRCRVVYDPMARSGWGGTWLIFPDMDQVSKYQRVVCETEGAHGAKTFSGCLDKIAFKAEHEIDERAFGSEHYQTLFILKYGKELS